MRLVHLPLALWRVGLLTCSSGWQQQGVAEPTPAGASRDTNSYAVRDDVAHHAHAGAALAAATAGWCTAETPFDSCACMCVHARACACVKCNVSCAIGALPAASSILSIAATICCCSASLFACLGSSSSPSLTDHTDHTDHHSHELPGHYFCGDNRGHPGDSNDIPRRVRWS